MGINKRLKLQFRNKKNYYLIKTYSFYRKDFFGLLRYKRLYTYKKAIYHFMQYKDRFYNKILNFVYHGIKIYNKRRKYKTNCLVLKKSLKFFYNFFRDKYIGKIGRCVKRQWGDFTNNFFGYLERRIDILVYRSLYAINIRNGRYSIYKKIITINYKIPSHPHEIVYIGDIIRINSYPIGFFPIYMYSSIKSIDFIEQKYYLFNFLLKIFLKKKFFFHEKKNILDEYDIYSYTIKYILKDENYYSILIGLYTFGEDIYQYILIIVFLYLLKNKQFDLRNSRIFLSDKYSKRFIRKLNLIIIKFINKKLIKFKFNKYFFSNIKNLIFKIKCIKSILSYRTRRYWYYTILIRYKYIRLLLSLKINVKYIFRMLKSRIKPLKYSNILIPDYNPIRSIKRFRVWKFSQNVYKYIKNIDELNFSFYGYPSYLEVNYKLHLFTVIRLPSYKTIIYPFNMDIHMFYDYFERKAYFQNLSR